VNIAVDTNFSNSAKPLKKQKASFAVQAVLSHRHEPFENKVLEKSCSLEHVKKKKHKKKRSQLAAADDHCDGAPDQHSSSEVTKPDVRLKSATNKRIKNAKSSFKSGFSDSISSISLPVVSNKACESLSVDSSVPGKGQKRKRYFTEDDSTVKLKKSQVADRKSDEVHVVADKRSAGPVKGKFNVVQLRSALQQRGRLSDAVVHQDTSCGQKGTVQVDEETATMSTKHTQFDLNLSGANDNSLPSKMVTAVSLSDLLKERMTQRLTSARFRFVNEQMYTSTGAEAAEMFEHDKDAFSIYHAGFQSQVSKWPTNPVDKMIDYITTR